MISQVPILSAILIPIYRGFPAHGPNSFRYYSIYSKMDWKRCQQIYDSGILLRDLKKFGYSHNATWWAKKNGLLKTRSQSENRKLFPQFHTKETKEKLSISRLRYLEEHPDEVPYKLNHSSKKSYPEIVFENALNSNNIKGWTYNYRSGIYAYDFAWPEQKIDVEIDGGTHLTDKVKRIDERRDIFSKSKGWTVLRFTAKEVKDDVTKCVNKLKENLRMCNSTGLE